MHLVPIHEAKAKLSALIALAEHGEEVVLTRHGKRVVRLAAEAQTDDASVRRARAEALWQQLSARRQAMLADMGPVIRGYNDLDSIVAANKASQLPNDPAAESQNAGD
jgi:prevent-host-death family protein